MNTQLIQRQYDEVIARHYDLDPQAVLTSSLDRAARQISHEKLLSVGTLPLRVLDVGLGTGTFLSRLKRLGGEAVHPYGLDLSEKMVEIARERVPDLIAEVDDATKLDVHFPGESFDLICTHFLTGYVPMQVLAPKIHARLAEGGFWSLVAGTKAGFPALQAKANGRLVRRLYGGRTLVVDDIVCNPGNRADVVENLAANGFTVRQCETFEPPLLFRNLQQFMDFAYRGGWLTPFVEAVGLHRAGFFTRWLMNWFFFPVKDHHSIEIVLAQRS
jgi:SAM-dependent methyltransferase